MNTKTAKNTIQRILLSVIALMFALSVAFVSPAYMQQQGGPYIIPKSVIAGGGGPATNNNIALTGTIGQGVLGISSGSNYSLNVGFWQDEPAGIETIAGNITYCVAPTPVGVPNVVLNLTGAASSSTNTDAAGSYQFSSLSPAGTYIVTPSKAGAASGINAQDIGRVRRFAALLDTPTACQTVASNVDNANPSVNAQDVGVLRRYVALLPNTADAGTWKFSPPSRTLAGQIGTLTADFEGILVGDVDGNWIPSSPQGKPAPQTPSVNLSVSLPNTSANQGVTVFVPVTVSGTLTSGDNVLGYALDLTFNQSVVATVPDPGQSFSTAGTISASGVVTENKTLSANRLRLVVDFNNPLVFSGTQTLIYIKLNVIGSPGQTSDLTWNPSLPPEFGNGPPSITATPVNGSLLVNNPSAVRLSSFSATAYDNGVFIEWKTGLEVDNLGFKIYRESDGRRELLTPEVIAGSALLAGATQLQTGRSYTLWDNARTEAAQYWLEDLDLNGNRSLHGPFGVRQTPGRPPARSTAATLSQIGRTPQRSTQAGSIHQLASSDKRFQQQQELSATSAVKITIREEGFYSVTRQELLAAGLDPNTEPRNVQLYLHGQEVPISVVGEEGRCFNSIEFYATGQDTPSTDAHVYWLTSTGRDGLRINHVKGDGARQTTTSFPFTVGRKDRTIYFAGLRNGEKENFFGPVITQLPVEQALTLSHLASGSAAPARLEVKLQGVTTVSHMVGIQLNGSFVGQVSFNGQTEGSFAMDTPQSSLREGINIVTLTSNGGPSDISLVDSIGISYQHTFSADGDSLRFTAPGNQEVRIEGFNSKTIRVIDITDVDLPTEIEGKTEDDKSDFAITVTSPAAGNRALIALSDSEKKHPASIEANVPSSWRQKEQAADLVIIGRRDLFAAANKLKTARQKQGLNVALVDIEDIYDEFNYGEKTPQTVKDFLSFAGGNWKLAPRFVLLIGDASADARNYLGAGDFDLVPTKLVDTMFMETASDDWLADFNNDGLPEMVVGRLPARTSVEADVMITKILDYASARPSEEALLVADLNDGYDFETPTRQLRPLLPSSLRIGEIDRGALDPATAKRQLLEGIIRGPLVVNYTGHGNVDQWRGDLLTGGDAENLSNSEKPAVFVMMTCLNGYFQDPILDGLSESLMKVEQGGAVAVWASSGMALPMEQWLMNQQLYRLLFGRSKIGAPITLGEAVVQAKSSIGDQDIRRTWILFGDPTMQVR